MHTDDHDLFEQIGGSRMYYYLQLTVNQLDDVRTYVQ